MVWKWMNTLHVRTVKNFLLFFICSETLQKLIICRYLTNLVCCFIIINFFERHHFHSSVYSCISFIVQSSYCMIGALKVKSSQKDRWLNSVLTFPTILLVNSVLFFLVCLGPYSALHSKCFSEEFPFFIPSKSILYQTISIFLDNHL
jgi:hypothetical protein